MSPKLVSIIIPTFNRAKLVVKAIRSVQAQSYPAIQIIVVDDGSQDETAEKVGELAGVEYYYQENRGQGSARNLGLKYAGGEYIASLDSDDTWNENFLEVAVAGLEKHAADFVFLNWLQICKKGQHSSGWENSLIWKKYTRDPSASWCLLSLREARELFIQTCPAPSSSVLIRRSSIVSAWNEKMKIADDWYLALEMILTKSCRVAFNVLPYWTKHIHDDSVCSSRAEPEFIRDLGLHDERLIAQNFRNNLTWAEKRILKKRRVGYHLHYGRLSWRRDGYSPESMQSILSAFKLAPAHSGFFILKWGFYGLKNRLPGALGKQDYSRE